MATATATRKAKVPKAKTKADAPAPEAEAEVKTRGRKRDLEAEAAMTEIVLDNVEIIGEFPDVHFKGIGTAAEAAGTDSIRAAALLYRHLAEEQGIREATPEAVSEARMSGLNWGKIDAMFGISRSQSQSMFNEVHGEGSHSQPENKLYGKDGVDGIKPKAEPKPKSERKSKKPASEFSPMFNGDESKEDILSKLDGKTVTIRVRASGVEGTSKVKVTQDSAKVGVSKGNRLVKFTDGKGNARTVALDAFLK